MIRKYKFTLILILILSMFPLNIFSAEFDNEYLKVKIGATKTISNQIILESKNGFNLYNTYDLGDQIEQLYEELIIIDANDFGEIDILNQNNNVLTTIPSDGSVVIGSTDYFDSIVEVENNKYRDYITFIVKC